MQSYKQLKCIRGLVKNINSTIPPSKIQGRPTVYIGWGHSRIRCHVEDYIYGKMFALRNIKHFIKLDIKKEFKKK